MKRKQVFIALASTVAFAAGLSGCKDDTAAIKAMQELNTQLEEQIVAQNEELTSTAASLQSCMADLAKTKGQAVAPGGKATFMVVFYNHPDKMDGMEFRVEAEPGKDALLGLPPEPEPAEEAATDGAEERGPAAKAEKPAVVDKKGTIVRLKPAPKKPAATN